MVLHWTGREVSTSTGANRPGHDSEKKSIVVIGSTHDINQYGWHTIWQAAETKYQASDYLQTGQVRVIKITTDDCKAEDDARP